MTIKAGVIMVSPDTKKILIVINRNTMGPDNLKFGLPKGHVEKRELVSHCAMRELKEETGIVSRVFKTDKHIVISETTYFLVKAHECLSPSPMDSNEIGDSRWVVWDDIMNTDCNRGLRLMRNKIKSKNSTLMKTLKELKPRKVGLCPVKTYIKQGRDYASDVGECRTTNNATEECWLRCDDMELP